MTAADPRGDAGAPAPPRLTPVEVTPWSGPLPPAVASFLDDAGTALRSWLDGRANVAIPSYPSDHVAAYRTLATLRTRYPHLQRFCEWGSGFGVVAGLAALLGYSACGIEIDRDLVARSRQLLGSHGLKVEIHHGSFVPADDPAGEELAPEESRTVWTGSAAGDGDLPEIGDQDLVFAFPWPTEHAVFQELFVRSAARGSMLITYDYGEGFAVYVNG